MTVQRIPVKASEIRVGGPDLVLFAIGLGSCVAIVLYDPRAKIGGLAHTMLPSPASSRRPAPPGRFPETALDAMLEEMKRLGAVQKRIYARLVGGAAMFESILADEGTPLGTRNIEASRAALKAAGIPIRGEEVGANYGRTIHFHIDDGRILVNSVRRPDVVI